MQLLVNTVMADPKKLNTELPYDVAILLLDIHLFTMTKTWKQPSVHRQMNN